MNTIILVLVLHLTNGNAAAFEAERTFATPTECAIAAQVVGRELLKRFGREIDNIEYSCQEGVVL